jgi:hypothetical protein
MLASLHMTDSRQHALKKTGSYLLVLTLAATSLAAAGQYLPASHAPSAAPKAEAVPKPSPAEIKAVIASLEDPKERAHLIQQLQVLQTAEKPSGAITDNTTTRAFRALSKKLIRVSDEFLSVAVGFDQIPTVGAWIKQQATDPARHELWLRVLVNLGIALGSGYLVLYLVQLALRRPRRAVAQRTPSGVLPRVPLLLLVALVDLLPVAAFAGTAYLALSSVSPAQTIRLVAAAWIDAVALVRLVGVGALLLFAADAVGLRIIPMSDEAARKGKRWTSWLAVIGIYGYFAIAAGHLLGLPALAAAGLARLLGLVLLVLLIVLVYLNRRFVAAQIRGPAAPRGPLSDVRIAVAAVWHVPSSSISSDSMRSGRATCRKASRPCCGARCSRCSPACSVWSPCT